MVTPAPTDPSDVQGPEEDELRSMTKPCSLEEVSCHAREMEVDD